LFTERLRHGGLKWELDDPRRTLFTRYSTSYASWSPGKAPYPEFRHQLTEEVAELREMSGFQHRKKVVQRILADLGQR